MKITNFLKHTLALFIKTQEDNQIKGLLDKIIDNFLFYGLFLMIFEFWYINSLRKKMEKENKEDWPYDNTSNLDIFKYLKICLIGPWICINYFGVIAGSSLILSSSISTGIYGKKKIIFPLIYHILNTGLIVYLKKRNTTTKGVDYLYLFSCNFSILLNAYLNYKNTTQKVIKDGIL